MHLDAPTPTLAPPPRDAAAIKGVGIVIPNLLSWEDSVVVLDVKQENFLITSGWRARYGQRCHGYTSLTGCSRMPVFERRCKFGREMPNTVQRPLFPSRPN